jgi:hypothetical protein
MAQRPEAASKKHAEAPAHFREQEGKKVTRGLERGERP